MSLVKTYLSKLPAKTKESESTDFYWKPKDLVPTDDSAFWFTMQSCERNFLAAVVKLHVKRLEFGARQTIVFVLRELLGYLQQTCQKS